MPALPKNELRELIAQARTDEALEQLLALLAGAPRLREIYHALTSLCGQFHSAKDNFSLGLIEFKELRIETARVDRAVLQYIDRLPDEITGQKGKTENPEITLRESLQSVAADPDWDYDLFFSFSSHDLDAAREFCYTLRGYGLRVFFSADDLRLRAGHSFGDVIEKALGRSRHFLLFCSPPAMQSKWVKLERETFFQQYHLRDEETRSFFIAEGPDFNDDLVPAFYRRYQRLQGSEDLLHSLVGSREASPRATTNESPGLRITTDSTEPSLGPTSADGHAWEFTTDADTPAAYAKYLTRFPQGFYAGEARARMEAFEGDDTAWEFASDAGTEKALQKYLHKYPEGLHVAEAREQLSVFDLERRAEEERKATAEREKKKQDAEERNRKVREVAHDWQVAAAKRNKKLPTNKEALYLKQKKEEADRKWKEWEEGRKKTKQEADSLRRIDPFHDLMVHIKGGTFAMGDTFGDGDSREKPVHKVTLSGFYLCKYPVTQGQWKAIMGNNPSSFTGNDMLPVENVSWNNAQEFIQKLNKNTGLKYRLPTEAEWEYAAREGGRKVRFGNGKDIADPQEMNFTASKSFKAAYSVVGKYPRKTTPVDQFKPNALGLHDMSGNVWEWCEDLWHGNYENAPKDGSGWTEGTDTYRVFRGGSWSLYPLGCRSAFRLGLYVDYKGNNVGFRVARGN